MAKTHTYTAQINWTGAGEHGTKTYKSFERSYNVSIAGKPTIAGSSDPTFLGDPACHNPEDMFVASVSSCHMLWYLHLCAVSGVTVTGYKDNAQGQLEETSDGSGRFTAITLYPEVVIAAGSCTKKAMAAHQKANKMCFIANSLNFPVGHKATISQLS
ncbi:MAG: peroxiredoxin [Kordiimonadales bacterium]|nr:MAG: peroxiredoxin [Kordiimonadales bacterium]